MSGAAQVIGRKPTLSLVFSSGFFSCAIALQRVERKQGRERAQDRRRADRLEQGAAQDGLGKQAMQQGLLDTLGNRRVKVGWGVGVPLLAIAQAIQEGVAV